MNKSNFSLSIILTLLFFALFLKVTAPSIFPGDSSELITASLTLGVTHGLGFPGFVFIAKSFHYLPLGSLAWRINLFSVSCGMVFVFIFVFSAETLLKVALRESKNKNIAIVSGIWLNLLLFTAAAFWYQVLRSEVYALFACLFLILLILTEKICLGEQHRKRWWFLLAFMAGISGGVHLYMSAPVLFVILIRLMMSKPAIRLKTALTSGTILILTSAVYLYIPLRASKIPLINFGAMQDYQSIKQNIFYFSQYLNPQVEYLSQLLKFIVFFQEQLTLPVLVLAVFGLFICLVRNWRLGITLALLIITNVWVYFNDADFASTHLDTLGFELVSIMVLVILAGIALVFLFSGITAKFPQRRYLVIVFITSILLISTASGWLKIDERNNFIAYRYASDVIRNVGKGH